MKLLLSLVTSILLFACSTVDKNAVVVAPRPNEEFSVYMRLFTNEAASRGLTLNYEGLRVLMVDKFGPELVSYGVIGLCSFQADKQVIYIDKSEWDRSNSYEKEMLIFHELGHCILDLEHDKSTSYEGTPIDVMYPSNFDSYNYWKERQAYLDRLFGKVIEKIQDKIKNPEATTERRNKIHKCRWKKVRGNAKATR